MCFENNWFNDAHHWCRTSFVSFSRSISSNQWSARINTREIEREKKRRGKKKEHEFILSKDWVHLFDWQIMPVYCSPSSSSRKSNGFSIDNLIQSNDSPVISHRTSVSYLPPTAWFLPPTTTNLYQFHRESTLQYLRHVQQLTSEVSFSYCWSMNLIISRSKYSCSNSIFSSCISQTET